MIDFYNHMIKREKRRQIIFDMMIDLAEKEYRIDIRKNSSPEQLKSLEQSIKKV